MDNKYICGGTLVSHLHIITAAHCVTKKGSANPVLKNTLTVYLGKHNLRTSVDGVQIRFVSFIFSMGKLPMSLSPGGELRESLRLTTKLLTERLITASIYLGAYIIEQLHIKLFDAAPAYDRATGYLCEGEVCLRIFRTSSTIKACAMED